MTQHKHAVFCQPGRKPAYAIIVAAGAGSRMGIRENKVFVRLGRYPVICRTVLAFEHHPRIAGIVVVAAAQELAVMASTLADIRPVKILALVPGGATRQESVRQGLQALQAQAALRPDSPVLIHDGARCFVSQPVIDRVLDGIGQYQACGAAVPVKDTIKEATVGRQVLKTPDRSRLWAMQTPQGAEWSLLEHAYRQAAEADRQGTDDLSLLEQAGHTVYLVDGDYRNIKITTPDDRILGLGLAEEDDQSADAIT
ncbi:MAG: 2-C-methyl-D-erythritol 4-phosphate cytidylyltransferase [Clostridiaceae bacterium]|nr:2-C-methyl-D-erythritol 4-phosphate cytidylyltransferase [Clostridiaceae bacterium]